MMDAVEGDTLDPSVEKAYLESIRITNPDAAPIERIDRFAFYERTKSAFAVVITGEIANMEYYFEERSYPFGLDAYIKKTLIKDVIRKCFAFLMILGRKWKVIQG
jgi:hypothetical protein